MSENVVLLGTPSAAAVASNGLIRKQILPKDKVYRWPNQPGKMLHITSDVLQQVVKNFKAGVVDVVPFFKVNDKNAHVEDPEFSRGKIVDLILTDEGLDALIETTSEDVKKQVLATGLGASAGLNLAYQTHDTGTNVGAVLRHVAWTPEPWIPGMKPFEQVSLSNETFEAVYLSAEDGEGYHEHDEGGEEEVNEEQIKAMLSAGIAEAVEPLKQELQSTKTALEAANGTIATLSTALENRAGGENLAAVENELKGMVDSGLAPAIADLAKPILLAGTGEVNLSSGETTTVAAQVRQMLTLIPKISFEEVGESGVPEGHVVLSAEQAKELGFKVEAKKDDEEEGGDAKLSAEAKADKDAIASVVQFIRQPE